MRAYAITVERGTDGSFLAWVDDVPGCAVRAATRPELLDRLPGAIADFLAWAGEPTAVAPRIVVTDELDSEIEADEDTEVLVAADRLPLTNDDLERIRPWLAKSRSELLDLLRLLDDERFGSMRDGSERTIREEIEHVAFVELMYVAWTFDLQSREGLAEFLSWTRDVAIERLEVLSGRAADDETWADWGGAPRLEPWSPRKAARRLLWHELLHLRAIERFAE
jgi:predicted RNase H-like HicB family nuclease